MGEEHRGYTSRKRYVRSGFLAVMVWLLFTTGGLAATGEDGGIRQHDLFEFEAFIKDSDIRDGNGPFDADNAPGNDAAADNKIVRTWDSVTYPLKITINPKKEDVLKNIKLRITGTLKNGASENRIHAKFAVGGTENLATNTVSFVQDYTVEQTGNSIMIPIGIDVQGAKHGVVLTPDIQVQVMSVDGVDISKANVITAFDSLPGVTTSAKVSIKPFIGTGLAGQGLSYYPYAGITKNEADKENMHAFSVAFGVANLPGKSSIKGATFPDPNGKINYSVELSGSVSWDAPAKVENLDFSGRDTPFMLLDQRPINNTSAAVGAANTLLDGTAYSFNMSGRYTAPQSKLPDLKQATIEKSGHHMVWDSGTWSVDAPVKGKNTVVYNGSNTGYAIGSTFPSYRADGYTGSALYGVNERVFSTNSFLVKMANEYRVGGPNNKDGKANNVNYRVLVRLVSYTDEFGGEKPFATQLTGSNMFTERNTPVGSMTVNHTLLAHPSNVQLGTPHIGDGSVSKGDASTIIGEDVGLSGYFLHRNPLAGGYTNIHRWNTDAFELTSAYAKTAEDYLYAVGYYNYELSIIQRDKTRQTVSYGVAKFKDNGFESFTKKGKDDYTWYPSFAEAAKHGKVGAMKNDVKAFIPPSHRGWRIPLRVNHANIGVGAETKNGTANVTVTNTYAYPDEDRTIEVDASANRAYHNPAIWDKNGTMTKKQAPSGTGVNFETLAVTPAETATALTSDKKTYYNSETVKWTAKSSIVLPQSGVPDDLDAGVTLKHVLPEGLDYKSGTGQVDGKAVEPEIQANADGTKTLIWNLLVSNSTRSIPVVTFETTINPFALSATGVQSSATVTSIMESELDQRLENLRTFTQDITILKVGMVGIYESIDKLHGGKNSAFKLTLSPYTTIEDEYGVTGLTVIPLSGDALGSTYAGSASVTAIDVQAQRADDEAVKVFVNKSPIYNNRPHEIDVSRGGWVEYTDDPAALNGAVSILFKVEGKMTNKDAIKLNVTVKTDGNAFGDKYLNETVINSATDYRLSPVSNRVRYQIRADLELALERIRIYTNTEAKGLPVLVRIQQNVIDAARVKDESVTLAVYNQKTGEKVTEKRLKQSELLRENELLIPAAGLKKGETLPYEVKIEGYDDLRVWVKDGEGSLSAEGHTAKEVTLTNNDRDKNGKVVFTGIAMTERELNKEAVAYSETLTVDKIAQLRVKAGYGFPFAATVTYHNDVLNEAVSRTGAPVQTDADLVVGEGLLDKTIEYAESGVVPLLRDESDAPANTRVSAYQLPQMYLEQGTGDVYSGDQKERGDVEGVALDAGHKLYVPVWIDALGDYDASFRSRGAVGSHRVKFDLSNNVSVYAYMFSYVDSPTSSNDGLLVYPVKQNDTVGLFSE